MSSKPFVTQISLELSHKLKKDLESQGFQFKQPSYTQFSAQKKGITCTLYNSGKLVIQGKDKDSFIHFYLEPEILKTFTHGYEEVTYKEHIGSDEAGKGDFFGSLCVSACFIQKKDVSHLIDLGIRDSKTISDKKIEKLSEAIEQICIHDIVLLRPIQYNELYTRFRNLNHLLTWAHAKALLNVSQKSNCSNCLVDQFGLNLNFQAYLPKPNPLSISMRPRAEDDLAVAAASILSRAHFIKDLRILSQKAGVELPKGAGAPVLAIGKNLFNNEGSKFLSSFCKVHFKTYQDLQDS
jgi:ribonuclease HIII